MPDPDSPLRGPLLNPGDFPHLADLVVKYAPVSTLPSLCLTCRALSIAVERRLQEHLLTTPHESSSALLHIWHAGWGYSPHTRTLDLYFDAPNTSKGDGPPPELAGPCTLPHLKHLRLISWLEDGSGKCAPLEAQTAIVPLLYAPGQDINPVAPQVALDLVQFNRFVLVYPPGPLDIEAHELHPGDRKPVEVIVVVPPTALAFDNDVPLPFPVRIPVSFPTQPPQFGELSMLAADSNFMTLTAAAGTLHEKGHRLTVVGIRAWIPYLREMLRFNNAASPGGAAANATNSAGQSTSSQAEATALKQLMGRYLEALGCEAQKAEDILHGVSFLSEQEWRDKVGEEEYAIAMGVCDVRRAFLDKKRFRPWAAE